MRPEEREGRGNRVMGERGNRLGGGGVYVQQKGTGGGKAVITVTMSCIYLALGADEPAHVFHDSKNWEVHFSTKIYLFPDIHQ